MARYGEGSEGFQETLARFKQQQSLREELKRKNAELADSEAKASGAETDAARIRGQIAQETEAVARREAAANELQSAATRKDTAAMQENVAARRSSMAAMTEQEALYRRHQALQQGLYETQARYSRTIQTQGIAGSGSQALAAQEAEIRRRMGLVERQIQLTGGGAPPIVPRGVTPEDPYGQRLLGPGRTTMVGGPGGVERTQPGGGPTGSAEATRRLNAEIQGNVAATTAQQAAVQREAVAERERGAAVTSSATRTAEATAIEGERRVATRESAVAFSALDQSMYRHGALTSEFIAAAARGEVTLRELGNQVLITTGKFAGWTAAAGLVYGAYRAIKDLGTGAVETQNQVVNLSRFIPNLDRNRAATQLRSLAQETNVPIKEVGDAASQFARVFHDQDQAFEAARASIILTKLDNLSAADSYRSLTAAIQGFHLEAKDIPGLMDSINASQREFGANVSQITAGFGRAAGGQYISNPGQDPRQTAQFTQALLATIIRTTGGQGANIGIALGRAGTRFSKQPANVATLAGYGIDASQGFDSIIQQAFAQIRKRNLQGQDVTKIAAAIGGPQFGARYFAGLLENQQLFENILKNTAPEKAKGTAQEELTKKLHSFGEEVKSVGVNIQALGSTLEQAGVFEPFRYAVVALSDMVRLGVDVVQVFAGLPAPLRDSLLAITGIVGAMRLIGRFGGSGSIAARIPGLRGLAGDDALFQRRLVTGVRTQRDAAYGAAEGYARTGVQRNIEAEVAANRVGAFQAANAGALAGKQGVQAKVDAEAEIARLEQLRANAIDAGNEAEARVLAAQRLALVGERELAQVKGLRASEARAFAAENNIPVPPSLRRPDASGLEYAGGKGVINPATGIPFAPVSGGEAIDADRNRVQQVIAREAESMRTSVSTLFTSWGAGLGAFGPSGKVGDAAKRGLATADRAAQQGLQLAESASIGAVGLASKVKALMLTNVTLLGTLAGGFIAYMVLAPMFKSAADKMEQSTNALQTAQDDPKRLARVSNRISQDYSPVTAVGLALTNPAASYRYSSEALYDKPQQQANDYILRTTIATQQAIAARSNRAIPNLSPQQFEAGLNKEVKDFKDGRLSQRQIEDAFARNAIELRASLFISSPAAVAQAKQALALARVQVASGDDPASYMAQLAKLDAKHLTQLVTATLRDLKAFGTTSGAGKQTLSHLASQLYRAEDIALNTGNQGDLDTYAQIQEQITSGIQTQVQSDLTASLTIAKTEKERQDAYAQAQSGLANIIAGPDREVSHTRRSLEAAQKNLANARNKLTQANRQPPPPNAALAQTLGPLGTQGPFGAGADPLGASRLDPKAEQAAVNAYRKQVKDYAARLKKAKDNRDEALRQYKAAVEQLKEQSAQDYAAGLDAEAAVREAGYTSQAAVLADKVRIAGQKVAFDLKLFGRDNRITEQAIAEQKQLIAQSAEQGLQDQQLREQLGVAGLSSTDTVGRARQTAAGARQDLAYIEAHKKAYGPDYFQAHMQALIAVQDTAHALADAAKQDAADLAQARFEYLESLTTDPLKIDQLQIKAAQDTLKRAVKPGDRYRALAGVNKAKQQYISDRVSGRESDIQFQLDMGQIQTDQAEKDLAALLKIRGITKQQKQDIQRKIHDLQNQSKNEATGFDLDVGNIKFPTIYDVRRAIGASKAPVDSRVQHNSKIDVNVVVNDPEAASGVYDAIDQALTTSVKATMKTAGLI